MTWLGDGPLIGMYMRRMRRFFAELPMYTAQQKREIVAGHMLSSKDPYILHDLATYDEAGDQIPIGWQHSYEFLWQSMLRRLKHYTETVSKRKKAESDKRAEQQLQSRKRESRARSRQR